MDGASDFSPLVKIALDHLDEGVMLIDHNDQIRLWNDAYLTMLDLPSTLVTEGADVMRLVRTLADRGDYGPGDPAVLAEQVGDAIRSRKAARGERQMASGNIIAAQWVSIDGGYFLFRLRNVTIERTASRFKDELIATVSHELRTPLTVISGALGLLRAGAGGETHTAAAELIDVAYKNSERLGRLVNDLLDIDKLQSNALDFHFEPVDLGDLLVSSVEQNLPYARNLGIAIELDLPAQAVIAQVDRYRLLQVMSNLLSNASKFSPSGRRVLVRLVRDVSRVRISVIDEGRGMTPEFRNRLFTRFAQENRASERGEAGTGLGLAICKNIVDRHHGEIHVETREGIGTTFHIDLPYRQGTTI